MCHLECGMQKIRNRLISQGNENSRIVWLKSPIRLLVQFLHYATAFCAKTKSELFIFHHSGYVQQTVLLQLVLQRAAADAERLRRVRAISGDMGERLAN